MESIVFIDSEITNEGAIADLGAVKETAQFHSANKPEGENKYPLKSIKFAFPIVLDGKEVDEIFLNKPPSIETLVVLGMK